MPLLAASFWKKSKQSGHITLSTASGLPGFSMAATIDESGGGGSPAKLFFAKFPANREKYREFRKFLIEIPHTFLGINLIPWGLLIEGGKT
jgi:hypothetical protein